MGLTIGAHKDDVKLYPLITTILILKVCVEIKIPRKKAVMLCHCRKTVIEIPYSYINRSTDQDMLLNEFYDIRYMQQATLLINSFYSLLNLTTPFDVNVTFRRLPYKFKKAMVCLSTRGTN